MIYPGIWTFSSGRMWGAAGISQNRTSRFLHCLPEKHGGPAERIY